MISKKLHRTFEEKTNFPNGVGITLKGIIFFNLYILQFYIEVLKCNVVLKLRKCSNDRNAIALFLIKYEVYQVLTHS